MGGRRPPNTPGLGGVGVAGRDAGGRASTAQGQPGTPVDTPYAPLPRPLSAISSAGWDWSLGSYRLRAGVGDWAPGEGSVAGDEGAVEDLAPGPVHVPDAQNVPRWRVAEDGPDTHPPSRSPVAWGLTLPPTDHASRPGSRNVDPLVSPPPPSTLPRGQSLLRCKPSSVFRVRIPRPDRTSPRSRLRLRAGVRDVVEDGGRPTKPGRNPRETRTGSTTPTKDRKTRPLLRRPLSSSGHSHGTGRVGTVVSWKRDDDCWGGE